MVKLIIKGNQAEIDGTVEEIIKIIEYFTKSGQIKDVKIGSNPLSR